MKGSIILFLIIFAITLGSCDSQDKKKSDNSDHNIEVEKPYVGTWLFVKKGENNTYVYCTDVSKSIIASSSIIHDQTPMEDSDFKISHIKEKGGVTYLYLDKEELSYYRFKWIDKEKGISQWILDNHEGDIYINKSYLDKVRKEKCEKEEVSKGKTCEVYNLSTKFNFKVIGTDFENKKKNINPLIAKILVVQKSDPSKVQEIRFEPSSWILYSDVPCSAISYFKKEKDIKESIENHHSFIIADYNFDGLEDFAYIWDTGGNGGSLFSYFFQDKKGEFYADETFPLQNGVFPFEINAIKKTLAIGNPVGCCKINKTIYQLKENNKWELIQSKQEDIN